MESYLFIYILELVKHWIFYIAVVLSPAPPSGSARNVPKMAIFSKKDKNWLSSGVCHWNATALTIIILVWNYISLYNLLCFESTKALDLLYSTSIVSSTPKWQYLKIIPKMAIFGKKTKIGQVFGSVMETRLHQQ